MQNSDANSLPLKSKKQPRNVVNISSNWETFLKNGNRNVAKLEKNKFTQRKRKSNTVSKETTEEQETEIPKHTPHLSRPNKICSKKIKEHSAYLVHNKKLIAMDCEMVEVTDGSSILARVSMVDSQCNIIYDTFVKPREKVTDYRTHVSGVRAKDFDDAKSFEVVQAEVASILKGKILIGHALKNDLHVLFLSHSKKQIRDTAKYKPFRSLNGGRTPSLKFLAKSILNKEIQEGEHDSCIDAKTCMLIYHKHKAVWEKNLKAKRIKKD